MDWGAPLASELEITLRVLLVSELGITPRLLCREVVSWAGWVVRWWQRRWWWGRCGLCSPSGRVCAVFAFQRS